MRKKVEPDKICGDCGTILKRGKEEYFCDVCKELQGEKWKGQQISVFYKGKIDYTNHTQHYDVCSWKCVAKWLNDVPLNKDMINFITIPYIASHGITFTKQLNDFLESLRE